MRINRLKNFVLGFLCMFLTVSGFAQNMRVTGTVYDTSGVKPLAYANVMAVRISDSLLLQHVRTDANGQFALNRFKVDTFTLYVEHPNFDTKSIYIFGSKENSDIAIESITMNGKSKNLNEVIVYANKNPIYFKGDTMIYIADSFKVGENAVVEDLLKKLPGLKVDENGSITSQGQSIDQVLVDGDEFFGSDPTIATRNLGAKGVETVQVYEKDKEDARAGEDDKIRVLDLKLKEDAKKGYFGKVSGASDLGLFEDKPFYETEVLANNFKGKQKISVFLLAANTPKSNFRWGDMNKFGLDNERENSGMNGWNQNNVNNTNGIPQTLKAGVYYSDRIGKNAKIGFNYAYYDTRLNARSSSYSQYFLGDTTYYTKDSSNNVTTDQSHRINAKLELNLDSLTTLELEPNLTLDYADYSKEDISEFLGETQVRSLMTSITNKSNSSGITSNSRAKLKRKFKKRKRELELLYLMNYSNNKTNGQLINATDYNSVFLSDTAFVQEKNNNNGSVNHYTILTFKEPLSKRFNLEFEYLYEFGDVSQDRKTYDFNTTTNLYDIENTNFSNVFDNIRLQNRAKILLEYDYKKHDFVGGVGLRNISIDNINLISGDTIVQNLNNILPQFSYSYRPSVSKRFRFNYSTNSSQPSINYLQPVQDNTNPNRIQVGNPDLKPDYQHNVRINFNNWSALTGRYLWSGMNAILTNNAFANATTFDEFGRTVSETRNVDGNIFSTLYMGAGLPLFNRKFEISPSVNANYMRYTNFIQNQENITHNRSLTTGLELALKYDSLNFSIEGNINFNNPYSTLSSASNTPYNIQNYSFNFEWRLPKHFLVKIDGRYTMNSQLSEEFRRNIFILNADISKAFLRTENLILSLAGNDILNQNINLQRQINGNVVTDNFTQIISRYFLVRMTYKFNNNRTKEEEWKGWH